MFPFVFEHNGPERKLSSPGFNVYVSIFFCVVYSLREIVVISLFSKLNCLSNFSGLWVFLGKIPHSPLFIDTICRLWLERGRFEVS